MQILNDYKFIGQGTEEGRHRSGVGLLLGATAQKALEGYNPVSDRIISARFSTLIGCLTVIQVYAPTAESSAEEIDSFYNLLQATVSGSKNTEFFIIMTDFSAKVGADWANASGALGKFGVGDINPAGERLIQFANSNNLVVSNTCFKQVKPNRLWTWESPDGHTHSMIDHILVSHSWKTSITNSQVYPGAD